MGQDKQYTVGVLTVSDRCSNDEAEDLSGPAIVAKLKEEGFHIQGEVVRDCVPDDAIAVQQVLISWSDVLKLDLILTTGGTGLARRDITPEATRVVLQKSAPGIEHCLVSKSMEKTPMAAIMRPAAGVRKSTLIINFPGSRKAVSECVSFLMPFLEHAIDLVGEDKKLVESTHCKHEIDQYVFNELMRESTNNGDRSHSVNGGSKYINGSGDDICKEKISATTSVATAFYEAVRSSEQSSWNRMMANDGIAEKNNVVNSMNPNMTSYNNINRNSSAGNTRTKRSGGGCGCDGGGRDEGNQVEKKVKLETTSAHMKNGDKGESLLSDNVADRARSSTFPMFSVDEALKMIDENVIGSRQTELMNVNDPALCGHILVNDAFSLVNIPPFPASIKDGYAMKSSDGAGVYPVVGNSNAGSGGDELKIKSNEIARISTGAPVPFGADCVVQVEDTELVEKTPDGKEELRVRIVVGPSCSGQDIRAMGSDIGKNQCILKAGSELKAPEIGLLASCGISTVEVYKKPVVAILSTGNEVRDISEAGGTLEDGKHILDSNRPVLMSMLASLGFKVVDCGVCGDDKEQLENRLKDAFSKADILITSGGVSMGEKDYLKGLLLEAFNATIHFGRVRMKPGKPTTFATCMYGERKRKKVVFGLPGNPVSCTVCFHLFVHRGLRRFMGHSQESCGPNYVQVVLGEDAHLDPRPEYRRGIVDLSLGNMVAKSSHYPSVVFTGNQISSRLMSMNSANCLVVLPNKSEKITGLKKGTSVLAMLL
eukprot:Nk52_evm6s639 gene=Nk52_evmTU6s639